jgi:hypothetical protein
MNRKTVPLIVLANLAVVLALVFIYPQFMISPGTLIEAHRTLDDDCFACHTPFLGSSPAKCTACHKVQDIGLVTTQGVVIAGEKKSVAFHQHLTEEDCVACHSDHKGVKAFRPISQFSHQLIEPSFVQRCDSCHSSPDDSLHRMIAGNCGQCHGQDGWKPATFDHDRYFRFDADHTTACATCHVGNDFRSYTCYGCHAHSRSGIRASHLEEGIDRYENCVECHRSGDAEGAEGEGHGEGREGRREESDD